MKNIFVTGKPGCGKTSLINSVLDKIRSKRIAGIMTPEIRKNKKRYGFKIIDLASRKEETLASIDIKEGPRVGKYKVNIEGINKIVNRFLGRFRNADLVVLDELGPMELKSFKFKKTIQKVLESDKPCLIVVHRLLVRKYEKYGEIFYLTSKNFTKLKKEIVKRLR